MSMTTLSKHAVHKYERANLSRAPDKEYFVYRCVLPNCSHYIQEELIWGRASICHRCGNQFIVQNRARLKGVRKLYCNDCKDKHWNAKPKTVDPTVANLLTRLGISGEGEETDS